jgi:F0F1-type ATP synthase assembly protein I
MMKLTGEYGGGIIAGVGLGIELCGYFVVGDPFLGTHAPWFLIGLILIGIGVAMARYSQKRPESSVKD